MKHLKPPGWGVAAKNTQFYIHNILTCSRWTLEIWADAAAEVLCCFNHYQLQLWFTFRSCKPETVSGLDKILLSAWSEVKADTTDVQVSPSLPNINAAPLKEPRADKVRRCSPENLLTLAQSHQTSHVRRRGHAGYPSRPEGDVLIVFLSQEISSFRSFFYSSAHMWLPEQLLTRVSSLISQVRQTPSSPPVIWGSTVATFVLLFMCSQVSISAEIKLRDSAAGFSSLHVINNTSISCGCKDLASLKLRWNAILFIIPVICKSGLVLLTQGPTADTQSTQIRT